MGIDSSFGLVALALSALMLALVLAMPRGVKAPNPPPTRRPEGPLSPAPPPKRY